MMDVKWVTSTSNTAKTTIFSSMNSPLSGEKNKINAIWMNWTQRKNHKLLWAGDPLIFFARY